MNAELAARAGFCGVNMGQERSAADFSELADLVERGDVKPRMGRCFNWTSGVKHTMRARKAGPSAESC